MNKKNIIGIDIEDYYGNTVDNIEFAKEIEIDLEEFNVRVTNFSFADTYEEDGEVFARLQYGLENEYGDEYEVTQINSEIMDVILENADGQLENEKEVSDKIQNALEILILK